MNSRRARRLLGTAPVLVALALGVAACGGGGAAQPGAGGAISVVASTNVWGSVVRAVGGDHVQVTSIVNDPSADPHSYQASAVDAAEVQSAQLLVYNGGGYDDFFAQLAGQVTGAKPIVAFTGETEHGEQPHGSEGGHDHGGVNEHVWYDPHVVAAVADQVATRLGEIDPAQRETFTGNAGAFTAKLHELEAQIVKIGTDHPGRKVVATEPIAHYLLEAAGVTDATPHDFAEAVENETDVPVAAQQEVTDLVSGKQVQAVVNNTQTVTPVTEKVIGTARDAGVPVVEVTETLPEGTTDYIAWMSGQVNALAGALSK
ncbi:zinc ABC transporter substrate-binding protein [Saccharomonospora sp. NPDC046836]|uniref:metal ABC transporter solute-binding protein, Zn/Mn family n=1 Tax=Saccharomonospora sp. NPDC046836 TaxID=3156921 RepID=UPI0033C198E5